jgi:hypothetical protein
LPKYDTLAPRRRRKGVAIGVDVDVCVEAGVTEGRAVTDAVLLGEGRKHEAYVILLHLAS